MIKEANALNKFIRGQKIRKKDIAKKMNMSLPTLRTFLADPKRMNGYQSEGLAEILNISKETLEILIKNEDSANVKFS